MHRRSENWPSVQKQIGPLLNRIDPSLGAMLLAITARGRRVPGTYWELVRGNASEPWLWGGDRPDLSEWLLLAIATLGNWVPGTYWELVRGNASQPWL